MKSILPSLIIGFFYYVLGNLSPKHRSRLGNIQLITVVKKSLISKYGMNAILEPFLNDVKQLVSPISIISVFSIIKV